MRLLLKPLGLATALAALAAAPAAAADKPLTTGASYDRNPVHVDAGSSDLLLFARSQAPCNRLGGCNPDQPPTKYDLVVRDLKSGQQTTIANPEPGDDWRGRTIAAARTADGTIHVFWADGGNTTRLYHLQRGKKQSSFTAPQVVAPLVFNVETVARGNDLFVYTEDNGIWAQTFEDGALGTPVLAVAGQSIPKVIVDKRGTFRMTMTNGGVSVASSSDGLHFDAPQTVVAAQGTVTNWDPSIAQDPDGGYLLTYAPDQGDGLNQNLAFSASRDFETWAPGFALTQTDGWWDYWPEADLKSGKDTLYFTSERPVGAAPAGTGHIWSMTP